jgi:azurin
MKRIFLFGFAIILYTSSCSSGSGNSENNDKNPAITKPAENAGTIIPGLDKLEFSDSLLLQANENMRFSRELFRIHAGKKIRLIFKNTQAKTTGSMSHNVVILKPDVDIADFAEVAVKAKEEQYVPSSLDSLIIAHTHLVGAGDSEELEFSIRAPGIYDFICSFPGHWGTMQGKIAAQ